MRYIKTYELWRNIFKKKIPDAEIGDYAIVIQSLEFLNNLYGVIIDVGRVSSTENNLYLIEVTTEIDSDLSETLKNLYTSTSSYVKGVYNPKLKRENVLGTWVGNEYNYVWVSKTYVQVYKNKEEFDKAVEEIETKKSADKYNL